MKIKDTVALPELLDKQCQDIRSKLIEFLTTVNHSFIDIHNSEHEDVMLDFLYELPSHDYFCDGYHNEYAITAVHNGFLTTFGMGDPYGDEIELTVKEVPIEVLSAIYSSIMQNLRYE